jgi:hypothetical protein
MGKRWREGRSSAAVKCPKSWEILLDAACCSILISFGCTSLETSHTHTVLFSSYLLTSEREVHISFVFKQKREGH